MGHKHTYRLAFHHAASYSFVSAQAVETGVNIQIIYKKGLAQLDGIRFYHHMWLYFVISFKFEAVFFHQL